MVLESNIDADRSKKTDAINSVLANVTITSIQNTYAYSPEDLWLAYGLAAFFTCIAALSGFVTMFSHHASYANNFSMVLRATRNAHISEELHQADLLGQDPIPAHVQKAVVTLGPRQISAEVRSK